MARLNIEIADALLAEAMEATGQTTKRATVAEALRTLIRLRNDIRTIRELRRSQQAGGPNAVRQRHAGLLTRTNIEMDDDLLAAAMAATGDTKKRETVDEALQLAVRLHRQYQAGMDLAGTGWDGDLNATREGWGT